MASQEASPSGLGSRSLPRSLWRNREYMLLWSGQLVSSLGSGIAGLAYPLLILALTNSPSAAGFAAALSGLPYLIFSLPAGALIDRWDRKRVMILCDSGRAISAGSIPIAAAFGHLTLAQLYLTTLIEGSLYVFFNIAETACIPRVVSKEQLASASAQNEGGSILTGLVSPPVGGYLFQVARTMPFLIDALSFCVSALTLARIRTTFQEERTAVRRTLRAEIAEGVSWLWRHPVIRLMAFLVGGKNVVSAIFGLPLIVIAREQQAPPIAIGLIFSIASVGGLAGSLVAPRIQRRFRFSQVILAAGWSEALLTPLLVVAPNVVVLGLVAGGVFVTIPIFNATQFSYRLSHTPDELQGRVTSAVRLIAFGFIPLGTALAGLMIDAIGASRTIVLYSVLGIVLMVVATMNPHIRAADVTRPE